MGLEEMTGNLDNPGDRTLGASGAVAATAATNGVYTLVPEGYGWFRVGDANDAPTRRRLQPVTLT